MTASETGQSNSILALSLELLAHPKINVHVASFPVLRKRVQELLSSARVVREKHSNFTFHKVDGMSLEEAIELKGLSGASFPHQPLARGHNEGVNKLMIMLSAWNGKEYVRVVDSCKGIINTVDPCIVIVDLFFNAACEACWSLGKKYIINCPMAPLDVAKGSQSMWKLPFYYPVFGSGIPFPIPWSYILKNVMLNFTIISRIRSSPDFEELMSYRHSHGFLGDLPMGGLLVKRSIHTFCFGLPELELPITLPPNIGLYGPVTLDSTPFSKEDELSEWLGGGKTIMMSMGTHFNYSEDQTRYYGRLNNKAKFQHILDEELTNEQAKGRFRIVDWIDADLGEVMKHANVAAYVHHGGANSYYEAALHPHNAGIPQIILAQWFDLYDMAARAEYIGIGIYGNRSVARGIDATEFGAAVSVLLAPGEAERFARKAKEVGQTCEIASGKKGVVAKILELAEDENSEG